MMICKGNTNQLWSHTIVKGYCTNRDTCSLHQFLCNTIVFNTPKESLKKKLYKSFTDNIKYDVTTYLIYAIKHNLMETQRYTI